VALPAGRFLIALGEDTLNWDATFTRIDSHPNLVTSWTIDRGRQLEFDRTDTGRATVEIADQDGILDPTNASGPYYGQIEPLLQAAIQLRNPIDGLWYTRFRGWVEELNYVFDPSQKVNRLTVSLVDIFEILAAIEMMPGTFGVAPPAESADQVFFEDNTVQDRIKQILGNALGAARSDYWYVFSGNVRLWETVYSPGESVLTAIQEAADAEFPGAPSNVYTDRFGRLVFHGRLAKFDPAGTAASTGGGWVFRDWKAGDHAAVNADPAGTARLNRFGFNRGLSHIINQGFATPTRAFTGTPLTAAENLGQIYRDDTSIGQRGLRSWTAENLLTKEGLTPDGAHNSTDLVETKRFAQWYVDNYKEPRNRTTDVAFRSARPGSSGATITWGLLTQIDIGDILEITIGSPGGGGFNHEQFFVEGIHEQVQPLNPSYDDVTVTVDLSPQAYYNEATWPFPH
jgi:hypothetical protein